MKATSLDCLGNLENQESPLLNNYFVLQPDLIFRPETTGEGFHTDWEREQSTETKNFISENYGVYYGL
jgi:hypothetical protein